MHRSLYPVTVVGSWPRPPALVRAMREHAQGRLDAAALKPLMDDAVLACLALEAEAGVDIVSDGEQRRDNFVAFVAEKLANVRKITVAELLEHVPDPSDFADILGALDLPTHTMVTPAAVGPIARRGSLALDEYRFVREHTDLPVKVALPGPYLLTRALWVEGLSRDAYPRREDLAADVVTVLVQELDELGRAGVDFVQLDEPILIELAFTRQEGPGTGRRDAQAELALAVDLINAVAAGFPGPRLGVHVCRGNWSTQEEWLLSGSYEPLVPYLERMRVRQLVLEFSTPRAGEAASIAARLPGELGLGVVNPRTVEVESARVIFEHVQPVARVMGPERIFLNPDCGFCTYASRPMASPTQAVAKLRAIVEAARMLRGG